MSTTLRAPAARQAAVLASIAALHLGAFILVSTGLRLPQGLLRALPSPITMLAPPPLPTPLARPDTVGPIEVDGDSMEMPDIEFRPPADAPQSPVGGQEIRSSGNGSGAAVPAEDYRAPAVRMGDARLQALIDSCYPSAARRQGQEGRGVARVVVDPTGRANSWNVEQSTGFGALDTALGCVARRLRFEPARRDGRAVEAAVHMPIVFRLH